MGRELLYGGEFSILQSEDSPDRLVLECAEEYGKELSRKEVERLVRNLQAWLDHGKETHPNVENSHECPDVEDCDDEELDNVILETVRRSAEECDVEKVDLGVYEEDDGEIYWNFYVLWGRRIAYTDMMRFLDGCDWVQEYASFFYSEDVEEIEGYDGSEIRTIYERKGTD